MSDKLYRATSRVSTCRAKRARPRTSEARGRAPARPRGLALCHLARTSEQGGTHHHKAHPLDRRSATPRAGSCCAQRTRPRTSEARGRAPARSGGLALCHLALISGRGGWLRHKARRSTVSAPSHAQAAVVRLPTRNRQRPSGLRCAPPRGAGAWVSPVGCECRGARSGGLPAPRAAPPPARAATRPGCLPGRHRRGWRGRLR